MQAVAEFQLILESAHRTQGHLFAPGTKKNIKSHIRQFILFCVNYKRVIVPADQETLVAFFELFSLSASYDHLKNVYSSIKFLHKALNEQFIEDEFQVNTILQSIKRKMAKVPFQVLPITREILSSKYNYIDLNDSADVALWCGFLVSFYCLFRKANVAPKSLKNFDPNKELSRKKLSFVEGESVVLVYNNWSKTNQFMNREIVIPLCQNSVRSLYPVFHLKLLLGWKISEDKPAFCYLKGGKLSCITYDNFTSKLKSLLDRAGYSPGLYSGHSLRRGGCSLLFQLNCSPLVLQAIGDWKTDQFLKYCGLSLEQRWSAQQLMSS